MSALARLRHLWRRASREREFDEELQFHVDMRVDRNLRAGMSREAADTEARRHVGSRLRAREGMRAAGGVPWLESLVRDAAYAARTLRRQPWFTAVAVLTFGVGIGLTIAVFSVVDRVLLRDLPYHQPHRLAFVRLCNEGCGTTFPADLFEALRDLPGIENAAFAGFPAPFTLTPDAGSAPLTLSSAPPQLLRVLGVVPLVGRDFTEADVREGRRVALISHETWHAAFGGAADVVGREIWTTSHAGRVPVTIVGVLPPGFISPLWVARVPHWDGLFATGLQGSTSVLGPLVRLQDGVTREAAREAIARVARGLDGTWNGRELRGVAEHVRVDAPAAALFEHERSSFALLLGATTVLLLLACANLSTLLLARRLGRDRDLAIAASLGATRWRLMRQALLEAWLVCALGSALALAVLAAARGALTSLVPPLVARYTTPVTDRRVVIAALGLALVCAAIAGLAPAVRATRLDLLAVLQRVTRSGRRVRWGARTGLIAAEAALGVVLVTGALLMIQTLSRIANDDVGYRPDGLYVVNVVAQTGTTQEIVFEQVAGVLREVPGVVSVAVADSTGLGVMAPMTGFQTEDGITGSRFEVSASFFDTVRAPLLAGRSFTAEEVRQRARVAILSRAAVSTLWPHEAPTAVVGRVLSLRDELPFRVIGVVPDFKRTLGDLSAVRPAVFLPYGLHAARAGEAVVRTTDGSAPPLALIQQRLRERASATSVSIVAVEDRYASALADPRFRAVLFGTLALAALLLAATGLYAVAAYDVQRREYEIGVRLAHGATGAAVRRMVIAQGLPPALIGLSIGLIAAFWAATLLQQFLYQVEPRDPRVFAAVIAIMLATALMAVWLPARRASRLDAGTVLRAE